MELEASFDVSLAVSRLMQVVTTYRVLHKKAAIVNLNLHIPSNPPSPPPDQGWIRTTVGGRRKLLFFL